MHMNGGIMRFHARSDLRWSSFPALLLGVLVSMPALAQVVNNPGYDRPGLGFTPAVLQPGDLMLEQGLPDWSRDDGTSLYTAGTLVRLGVARSLEVQLADRRWLQINERRTKDGGYVSVGTNITSLKQQERKLKSSETRLLATIEDLRQSKQQLEDLAEKYVELNRRTVKHADALEGMTQINMFFEASTRTQASFELAGKRLGADVMNMSMQHSSVKKGETLIDTALTLNAMHPDLLVVRHPASGAVDLLAQKVNCAVLNAGDGRHEHPTRALLGALTIRRAKGRIQRLTVAICGDIAHSRVARSNLILLGKMENRLRLIGPPTLMPSGVQDLSLIHISEPTRPY